MAQPLAEQLAELDALGIGELRVRWAKLTGRVVPRLSTSLLRLAVAYEVQVRALGGLSRGTQQRLTQLAAAKTVTRQTQPGMRLVREWNGTVHVVTIGEKDEVSWNGKTWRSLSEVARAITGTRWSGPAFFGLKQTKKAAWNGSAARSTPASRARRGWSRISTRSMPSARPVPPTY